VAGDGTHQAGGCSRALEMSNKWQVTDASLLRCCKMLKGAAQECDDRLHKCMQRILEVNWWNRSVRLTGWISQNTIPAGLLGEKNTVLAERHRSCQYPREWAGQHQPASQPNTPGEKFHCSQLSEIFHCSDSSVPALDCQTPTDELTSTPLSSLYHCPYASCMDSKSKVWTNEFPLDHHLLTSSRKLATGSNTPVRCQQGMRFSLIPTCFSCTNNKLLLLIVLLCLLPVQNRWTPERSLHKRSSWRGWWLQPLFRRPW